MFDSWTILALGLVTGLAFGFLLQKGRVTKFEVIVNQFLLRDFTVLKTMLTAIVVGGIGVYALADTGLTRLSVKPALLIANVAGGLIFGAGMVLLGLCPGTAVAALGEGNRRALAGIIGMVAGAALLTETYPYFADAVRGIDLGNLTWPQATDVSPWFFLVGLAVLAAALFIALERWERGPGTLAASAPGREREPLEVGR
jgi:uncharacterized membrane protein YedE/YeeE